MVNQNCGKYKKESNLIWFQFEIKYAISWWNDPQQAADVATVIAATNHMAEEVNGLKKMSSEELTETVDVLDNVKNKMKNLNTSTQEAEKLMAVRKRHDLRCFITYL